jgi:MraZ protein
VPPRFRLQLKDGLVMLPGVEKCVVAYPAAEWEKLSQKMEDSGLLSNNKTRTLNRALFGQAFPTNLDAQGRISLPVPLRAHAGISDDVVVVGVNTTLELWSKTAWEAEKTAGAQDLWQIIESLEK